MKIVWRGLLVLFLAVPVYAGTLTLTAQVQLDDQTGSEAVGYAVRAFRQDIQRKLGFPDATQKTVPLTFVISKNWNAFDHYRIEVNEQGITFTGSDELGLIHGIYSFSGQTLGIDPCIHFTGILPTPARSLALETGTTESRPYTFRHRIMFINDEDLVIGFQMEKQAYGMNMAFMEKLYETMLRLGMTGVIPSTLVLSDEPHLKRASDMGLYIAQHHAEPVGSVPLFWPKNIPYSWSTQREHFIKFWSDAIRRQKGQHVIWTLNFRGLLDRAFWDDDPSISRNSPPAEKARIVNEVIQTQYDLIRKITGEDKPLVAGYLWGELSGLYASGLLHYPADTMLLFSDSGHGTIAEDRWKLAEKCTLAKGIYEHVSYHNRKTHMRINTIHPDVFFREMKRAVEVGATDMIVLNVGNFKEKIFGIRQMTRYMNHFEDVQSETDGNSYFDWYALHQLGTNAPAVADSYRDFFSSLPVFDASKKQPGDEYYFYYVERVLNMAYGKTLDPRLFRDLVSKPEEVASLSAGLAPFLRMFKTSSDRWTVTQERAYAARRFLSGSALDFYDADLVFPTRKMTDLTAMAVAFTQSIQLYEQKKYHASRLAAYQALHHARRARDAEKKIEQAGPALFEGWYDHDETARTAQLESLLQHFIDQLGDLEYFNLDYRWRNPKTPGLDYKFQPGFDSEYRDELIYMNNAE